MKKLLGSATLALSLSLVAPAAFAGGTPQNHHCKMPDGSMDMNKTHKQCTAAGGKWAKDAAPAPTNPPPGNTPAPAPAH